MITTAYLVNHIKEKTINFKTQLPDNYLINLSCVASAAIQKQHRISPLTFMLIQLYNITIVLIL